MKKQYIFVSNWKINMSFSETIEFATNNYDKFVSLATNTNQKITLCPSFESLYPLTQIFKETPVSVGSQNCSSHTHGSFTGQVPAQNLQEVGCSHCIIGHSETRKEFCETDEKIAQKCIHLLDYDVIPIVCVGETEEEHKNGKTLDVLKRQLEPLYQAIGSKTTVHSYLEPYIAYEPVWSIGTGSLAKPEHIEMVLCWISDVLKKKTPSVSWKMIYGGSVSPENIGPLKKINLIDGFLVGNASLDFQNLEKIVELSITQ